jgi:hypothetical protein
LSDYDIITKYLKYSVDDTQEMLARLKIQKLEDAKMQILGQNPQLLGIGIPADEQSKENSEIGATPEGPNPDLSPEGELPALDNKESELPSIPETGKKTSGKSNQPSSLPEPTPEEIELFDMGIEDYAAEQDNEEIDFSEEEYF